jgi:hypothetical protein
MHMFDYYILDDISVDYVKYSVQKIRNFFLLNLVIILSYIVAVIHSVWTIFKYKFGFFCMDISDPTDTTLVF